MPVYMVLTNRLNAIDVVDEVHLLRYNVILSLAEHFFNTLKLNTILTDTVPCSLNTSVYCHTSMASEACQLT
jgi:hypothetical protein